MTKKKAKKVKKKPEKKALKNSQDDKILKNLLITTAIILVGGFLIAYTVGSEESFEYRGVEFKVVEFCDAKPCLTTYNTKLPVIYEGKNTNYNFYLRNDPRKLEGEVPFEGDFELMNKMILEVDYGLACEGYSSVAMDNLGNLMRISEINVETGDNSVCGPALGSMRVTIQESDQTWVEEWGESCYKIHVADCDIIKGVERFMYEVLVEVNKQL